MNWEAIGAIGELVGAVAVLVTIIYLAVQVRHTRKQLTIVGMQARGSTAVDLLAPIANDPEMAQLQLKMGHPRYGDFGLEPVEAQRMGAWLHMWFQVQQANHYLLPPGTHDELLQMVLSVPSFAEFWQKNKGAYDGEFVERLQNLMSEVTVTEINPDDIFERRDRKRND